MQIDGKWPNNKMQPTYGIKTKFDLQNKKNKKIEFFFPTSLKLRGNKNFNKS
jgi:hypothetical protein